MTPLWYDVESPHCRWAVGQIEVENGKVVQATPAYRWAVGLLFEEMRNICFKQNYHLATRYVPWAKSLGTTNAGYKRPRPSDRELLRRLSP